MNEIIRLITESFGQDEIGQDVSIYSEKKVFAEIRSITQNEFNVARQNGLSPEIEAVVWDADYHGEEKLRYNGRIYKIYRVYKNYDRIELYCERLSADA